MHQRRKEQTCGERDNERLERQLDKLSKRLPKGIGGPFLWLRAPTSRWVRIPAGVLLIIGGVFGFLPIIGFWMAPLGALLIAQDVPFLRRPTLRALGWLEHKWDERKRLRRE